MKQQPAKSESRSGLEESLQIPERPPPNVFTRAFRKFLFLVRASIRAVLVIIWRVAWRLAVVALLVLTASVFFSYNKLPTATELADTRSRNTITFFDRRNQPFAWRGDRIGQLVTPDVVSPHLVNAIISVEDRSFFNHFGISPRGIIGAIAINLREGRGALEGHGGSTITQQVVKLICFAEAFDPERWKSEFAYERDCRHTSLWRKVKEIPYALALEIRFTKDEILTIYLNRAYLGAGATGFETASFRYFGKSASELDVAEAAMLAGLLSAPSRNAPTRNLQRAQDRSRTVIGLMKARGHISQEQADAALATPARLSSRALDHSGAYFADWVQSNLPDVLTRQLSSDLAVRTTFDRYVQSAVDEAVNSVISELVRPGSRVQVAVLVMTRDGAVRAMLGGRPNDASGHFNRAVEAKRQPGSLFKPFVYAAAIEAGRSYRDIVVDRPVSMRIPGSGRWSPRNYEDRYLGRVSLTTALAESLNSVAVRLSEETGRERVRRTARRFGIASELTTGPSIALGASEVSLLEITGAYTGFLNWGFPVKPYGIEELRVADGGQQIFERDSGPGQRVVSGDTAQQLIYMLHRVITDGTGQRARLDDWQAAGKTGTSQKARDAWFVGFTAKYVAGVWMGYDDNTPLTAVTGGGLPAEIWKRVMDGVHEGLAPAPLPIPGFAAPPASSVPSTPIRPQSEKGEPEGILDSLKKIFGL